MDAQVSFRGNRTYKAGDIIFDIISSENHNMASELTRYRIENGSVINDHYMKLMFQGSVTARVSNHSLRQDEIFSNRAQEAYDKLYELWEAEELVDIVLIYRVFNDMAITNISTPRDGDTGESLIFEIAFEETRIVSLQEFSLAADKKLKDMIDEKNRQAAEESYNGKQVPKIRATQGGQTIELQIMQ